MPSSFRRIPWICTLAFALAPFAAPAMDQEDVVELVVDDPAEPADPAPPAATVAGPEECHRRLPPLRPTDAPTLQQSFERLKHDHPRYAPLSFAEFSALRGYTDEIYKQINTMLLRDASKSLVGLAQQVAKNPQYPECGNKAADRAQWTRENCPCIMTLSAVAMNGLRKIVVDHTPTTPLYRGEGWSRFREVFAAGYKTGSLLKGKKLRSRAFVSTTRSPRAAWGGQPVLYRISDAALVGRYIRDLSVHPPEDEVLIPPFTKFKVTGFSFRDVVLPEGNYNKNESTFKGTATLHQDPKTKEWSGQFHKFVGDANDRFRVEDGWRPVSEAGKEFHLSEIPPTQVILDHVKLEGREGTCRVTRQYRVQMETTPK